MIICIKSCEYNLQYDKWKYSLDLLKDLLLDCLQDIKCNERSTCCNVYTYHGSDITYVEFYNIPNNKKIIEVMKVRSIAYTGHYEIVECGDECDMGDLVLVDDEESEEDIETGINDIDIGALDIRENKVNISTIITQFTEAYSDNNVSDYLLSTMASNILYCESEDILYGYEDGNGWLIHSKDKLHTLISNNISTFFEGRDDIVNTLGSFYARSRIISDMLMKIKSLYHIKIFNDWHLIGFKNGVYDNATGFFQPFHPSLRVTLSTHLTYTLSGDEENHILSNILLTIFPNPIIFKTVMRWFGYMLVSGNPEKMLTIWYGQTGNNGKSWVQRLIREGFGDYYATLPVSLLTGKRSGSGNATPELACLENRLVVALQEPDITERLNGGRVKELTGNDSMFIRELYKSPRSINIRAKIIVVANNRIETVGLDSAMRRRFFVIPFESTFVSIREFNLRKSKKLDTTHYYIRRDMDELCKTLAPAFMRLAIDEHKNYLERGMEMLDEFGNYTTDFIMSNNKVLRFIHRYLISEPGERYMVKSLYESFKTWYKDLYPSSKSMPNHDDFLYELNKESIKIVDDVYIEDYVCTYILD